MKPKKSSLIVVAILILFIMSACLAGPATPTPVPPTPCGQSPRNMYSIPQQVTSDYAAWENFTHLQALSLLTKQVERWSDYEDIVLDDKSTYRITITLVTPELRRAAFIMEAIHRRNTPAEIRAGIEAVANSPLDRSELRFLVTATLKYTGDNRMEAQDKITIPAGNLVMLDHHARDVQPATIEGALLTSFDVVDGPYAAYVTFPILNEKCELNLDVLADTSATVLLRNLKIGEKEFPEIAWILNLSPLVSVSVPTLIPNPALPAGTTAPAYLEPITIPPTPNPGDTNLLSLDNYWIELSKFIWSKLSTSNSR